MKLIPVRLPPGRARLATKPSPTGSSPETKTMGIVVVAAQSGPGQQRRPDCYQSVLRPALQSRAISLLSSSGWTCCCVPAPEARLIFAERQVMEYPSDCRIIPA
jgi:hypothetical protein